MNKFIKKKFDVEVETKKVYKLKMKENKEIAIVELDN